VVERLASETKEEYGWGGLKSVDSVVASTKMTGAEEVAARREQEAIHIRLALAAARGEQLDIIQGGETMVAYVTERLCIGCDQCLPVCDDDAILMYHKAMASPIIDVESNTKAKILRDDCTGCRLCVLACPTDAITMIER